MHVRQVHRRVEDPAALTTGRYRRDDRRRAARQAAAPFAGLVIGWACTAINRSSLTCPCPSVWLPPCLLSDPIIWFVALHPVGVNPGMTHTPIPRPDARYVTVLLSAAPSRSFWCWSPRPASSAPSSLPTDQHQPSPVRWWAIDWSTTTASVTISVTRSDPSRPGGLHRASLDNNGSETGRRELLVPLSGRHHCAGDDDREFLPAAGDITYTVVDRKYQLPAPPLDRGGSTIDARLCQCVLPH